VLLPLAASLCAGLRPRPDLGALGQPRRHQAAQPAAQQGTTRGVPNDQQRLRDEVRRCVLHRGNSAWSPFRFTDRPRSMPSGSCSTVRTPSVASGHRLRPLAAPCGSISSSTTSSMRPSRTGYIVIFEKHFKPTTSTSAMWLTVSSTASATAIRWSVVRTIVASTPPSFQGRVWPSESSNTSRFPYPFCRGRQDPDKRNLLVSNQRLREGRVRGASHAGRRKSRN